ncbi:hypothetical protein J3459_013655 [Metarhizium acridum]|nr:hypothetical protein J3459_013655 [Metarhizium acridum]
MSSVASVKPSEPKHDNHQITVQQFFGLNFSNHYRQVKRRRVPLAVYIDNMYQLQQAQLNAYATGTSGPCHPSPTDALLRREHSWSCHCSTDAVGTAYLARYEAGKLPSSQHIMQSAILYSPCRVAAAYLSHPADRPCDGKPMVMANPSMCLGITPDDYRRTQCLESDKFAQQTRNGR